MSIKERLRRQERRISGGVVLAPDGEPVIRTPDGYQFDGLFYGSLRELDPGKYRLVDGPEVPFDDFWESGRSWGELVEGRSSYANQPAAKS